MAPHGNEDSPHAQLRGAQPVQDVDAVEIEQLEREVRRLRTAIASAERDLARHRSRLQLRADADLLATWLHLVPRGVDRVRLTAYDAEGAERLVDVELDAALSPTQNLSKKYVQAAKAERGHGIAAERIAGLEARLEAALARLEVVRRASREEGDSPSAGSESGPRRVPRQDSAAAPRNAESGSAEPELYRGAESVPKALRPRVCYAEDGSMILVGRSETGNDYLTNRIANGNDIFFHVAGTPGSHVILRWGSKAGLPSPAAMEDAALLAAHFSKMKDASRVGVSYAPKKHVHKPKGARPGLVVVNRPKSITVRRDPARLARLLGKEVGSA